MTEQEKKNKLRAYAAAKYRGKRIAFHACGDDPLMDELFQTIMRLREENPDADNETIFAKVPKMFQGIDPPWHVVICVENEQGYEELPFDTDGSEKEAGPLCDLWNGYLGLTPKEARLLVASTMFLRRDLGGDGVH